MVGIAMPPKADNPRLDPNFLGDRPGAAPVRRQQNYPRPLQIALQRHRRATTRLKHPAIFPRKVDFSCFGYHPDVESRLTIQEKWVLVPVNAVLAKHNFRVFSSQNRYSPSDDVRRTAVLECTLMENVVRLLSTL